MVFAVVTCRFIPRTAQEIVGNVRLDNIIRLVEACDYGVHDLSRVGLSNGLPRFNMPFELGLFVGAQRLGGDAHAQKSVLVLERDAHRHQRFISDLAGIDVSPHHNNPDEVIAAVRNWLASASTQHLPYPTQISRNFTDFTRYLEASFRQRGIPLGSLTFVDVVREMADWVNLRNSGVV